MANIRYRTPDLPAEGVGAFMPIPAISPASSSFGLVEVSGAPGTEPTPAPAPQRSYLPTLTAAGGVNSAQGSNVSPDVALFSVYVAYADNQGPAADAGIGMARRRYAELPMPAINPTRLPTTAMRTPVMAGRAAMGWPRAFQRFPIRGT